VIAHIVLFKPRASLNRAEATALIDSFSRALAEIPSIRRTRVGRRIKHGRAYEQMMREDYEYAVVLEFDDVDGLLAYLQHPSHDVLAERFFAAFDIALMYDYDMGQGQGIVFSD
jgi:Stress responsive A/B Barrel Domain